jgi:hypothetical protein
MLPGQSAASEATDQVADINSGEQSPATFHRLREHRVLRWITWALVGLHLGLLLAALPNYRASVDSAYHTAIGRQYGVHGAYFWDHVHYAPAHRPNLQGPAVHVAIGLLGRILGGEGEHYVLANGVLGIACWLSAVGTTIYFARRLSGDRAALLATAIVTGGVNTAGSLAMNLPVFWMFIATAWSIHFLLRERLLLAIGLGALACYSHLGGFATLPIGLAVATALSTSSETARVHWRQFTLVGVGLVVVTAPYWIHVLRSLAWYVGAKSDTAWWIDPVAGLFWLVGLMAALRAPRRNRFLVAWAAAPVVWIIQDTSRFILVSALPGSLLGSVAIAQRLEQWQSRNMRHLATGLLVYVATVFPLGIPALGGEIFWLVKPFPVLLDWDELQTDAEVIERHRLNDRIVQGYTSYVVSGLSVFADIEGEKGHWVEVQPPFDPSDDFGVAEKTYVVATPPDDEMLASWQARGWIKTFGGGRWSTVLRFSERPSISQATRVRNETLAREAAWLAEHGEHNTMGNFFALVFDQKELPRRRAVRGEGRARTTRMQMATLLYAYALETVDPQRARQARDEARALGWIAALQGDEMTLDYRSAEAHAQFRLDMAALAVAAAEGEQVDESLNQVLDHYLSAARGGLLSSKSRP